MDSTVQALVDLLLKAVPTVIFFVILAVYLKFIFFRPLAKVLDERKKATEGVRELARQAFEAADKKTAEFERALQLARAELHKENELLRQQWVKEQSDAIINARAEADRQIQDARQQIARETEKAQAELTASVEPLSEQIVRSLLRRRAA
jgi:F0F1-type ATP synthase membrane subunit b/b'